MHLRGSITLHPEPIYVRETITLNPKPNIPDIYPVLKGDYTPLQIRYQGIMNREAKLRLQGVWGLGFTVWGLGFGTKILM